MSGQKLCLGREVRCRVRLHNICNSLVGGVPTASDDAQAEGRRPKGSRNNEARALHTSAGHLMSPAKLQPA